MKPLVRGVNRGYASQAEASDAKVEGAKCPEFLGLGRELAGGQPGAEPADHRGGDLGQLDGRAVPGPRDEDDLDARTILEDHSVGLNKCTSSVPLRTSIGALPCCWSRAPRWNGRHAAACCAGLGGAVKPKALPAMSAMPNIRCWMLPVSNDAWTGSPGTIASRALFSGAPSSLQLAAIKRDLFAERHKLAAPIAERAIRRGELPAGTDPHELIGLTVAPSTTGSWSSVNPSTPPSPTALQPPRSPPPAPTPAPAEEHRAARPHCPLIPAPAGPALCWPVLLLLFRPCSPRARRCPLGSA